MKATSVTKSPKALRGIVVPLVTPLEETDSLDIAGLEGLIEHVIAGGVSGIFILGTTGEFASLSYRLRYELIERACKQINSRVDVLVGITDTSITESVRIASKAAECGADAVVSAPPYYFAASQQELTEYYEKLCRQVPLPLYLYNMPVHTKVSFDPSTVARIADNRNVVGLKDSSGNAVYFRLLQHAMRDKNDFALFVGPEEIAAEAILLGAAGGVNGGANMFPELYVQMYNAAASGDLALLKMLQENILMISSRLYNVGRFGSSYLKGLKCALSILGLCNDFVAEPFNRFHDTERKKIDQSLNEIAVALDRCGIKSRRKMDVI